MIGKEELIRISRIQGMKPYQQEKHYVQTLILRSIYSKFDPVFKGGTALMFRYGLNRFSEDLDFTCGSENIDGHELLGTVTGDLEYLGIGSTSKIITDNKGSFSCRIGALGPLYTKEIERCFVRIEISRRETVVMTPQVHFIEVLYPDVLPFSLRIMDKREMFAEKIRAILMRNRSRDVYDLWYLLKDEGKGEEVTMDNEMISLINVKLSYYGHTFDVKEFWKKILEKEDLWQAELTPIIFGQVPDFAMVRNVISKNFEKVSTS